MVLKTQPMLSPAQRLQPNAHVLGEKGERGNAPILESSVVVLRKRGRSLGVKWWRIIRRSCSVGPPLASRSVLSNQNKKPGENTLKKTSKFQQRQHDEVIYLSERKGQQILESKYIPPCRNFRPN